MIGRGSGRVPRMEVESGLLVVGRGKQSSNRPRSASMFVREA